MTIYYRTKCKWFTVAHLYHSAQQKLRYEIVKNWSRCTPKRLYFDLKIAIFFSGRGLRPQTSMVFGGWGLYPQTSRLRTL